MERLVKLSQSEGSIRKENSQCEAELELDNTRMKKIEDIDIGNDLKKKIEGRSMISKKNTNIRKQYIYLQNETKEAYEDRKKIKDKMLLLVMKRNIEDFVSKKYKKSRRMQRLEENKKEELEASSFRRNKSGVNCLVDQKSSKVQENNKAREIMTKIELRHKEIVKELSHSILKAKIKEPEFITGSNHKVVTVLILYNRWIKTLLEQKEGKLDSKIVVVIQLSKILARAKKICIKKESTWKSDKLNKEIESMNAHCDNRVPKVLEINLAINKKCEIIESEVKKILRSVLDKPTNKIQIDRVLKQVENVQKEFYELLDKINIEWYKELNFKILLNKWLETLNKVKEYMEPEEDKENTLPELLNNMNIKEAKRLNKLNMIQVHTKRVAGVVPKIFTRYSKHIPVVTKEIVGFKRREKKVALSSTELKMVEAISVFGYKKSLIK
ncbi:33375_t:CDS:2 [Gigaspora margarita]|uniref:33375_t:CDS:1 n=1 Tax=Gigaspora margarita TaxID=4874 RepID=A0ABM8VWV5_GIGMA|nr:33375_t:CDS:2 [Gigaspora margarita]